MRESTAVDPSSLVSPKRGHFRLESGHHAALWLELDSLFAQPARVRPFVDRLAATLRSYDVAVVCGPLVGGAFLAHLLATALDAAFCFTERVATEGPAGLYRARYRLPTIAHPLVRGARVALVDDAISAGSSVRATYAELVARGAEPVVVGALLLLGSAAGPFFAERNVPLVAVTRLPFDLWVPAQCPLCASGAPLEDPAA